ncbi:S41 family peptidase, partial [Patescibacteria group bacterium]
MYNEIIPQTQPKKKSVFFITVIIIISAFILLSLGFVIGVWQTVTSTEEITFEEFIDTVPTVLNDDQVDFGTFRQVWNAIQTRYVHGSQSEEDMYYGSLTGLVASLNDPYSVFFDPETTKDFNRELEGKFEGIGAEIGFKDDQLVIVAPLPDSPASEAGLQSNDKIMAIDDVDSAGMSLSEAVSLIRGQKGTVVELGIIRDEGNELFTVSIIRDTISLESVEWELFENDIAYLRI